MKVYEDLDDLLKQSLSVKETPSAKVNAELKYQIINQVDKNKGISIWWIPMMTSLCMASMEYLLVKMLITPGIFQHLLIIGCVMVPILIFTITVTGIKYFDLRKGARVNI